MFGKHVGQLGVKMGAGGKQKVVLKHKPKNNQSKPAKQSSAKTNSGPPGGTKSGVETKGA